VAACKAAGLKQKDVAERVGRGDGSKAMAPYLNDLEHDRFNPARELSTRSTCQAARHLCGRVVLFTLGGSPVILARYFDNQAIEAACRAFRETLSRAHPPDAKGPTLNLGSPWE